MKNIIPTLICLLVVAVAGSAQEKPLLLQEPALSQTQIAFNFAGDLWITAREGGEAARLLLTQMR